MSAHVHARITHAVCARHLRYVYTHARFLPCLYTYGRSLTEPTIGDRLTRLRRLETVWVRSPHVQTECLTRQRPQTVCVHKSAKPTHLHVLMRHYKSRAHMIFSIGFVHACPCACPHISYRLAQYSISI